MSLADDVVELLLENGPMELEFIRNRLCVASRARIEASLLVATAEGRLERCWGDGSSAYRIPGDTRVPQAGDIHGLWKQRKRASA